MMIKLNLLVACVGGLLLNPAWSQSVGESDFEGGELLKAADLLPPDALRGNSFRVRDQVVTDGYMAHFEIDTDFGIFRATGVKQAKARGLEAEAIRKLVETSKSDLFAEGLRRSIAQPVDAVANIVSHPVETAKQAPKTVGHFFGKVGSSIERAARKASKTDGEEDGAQSGGTGKGIGQAAKSVVGFDKAKLDTAKQLGVDPYSDNARLQEEMEKVTWAFFAGGLPLRIGAAAASAGMALAATNMAGLPEDTYALTRSELALRDQRAMEAMGVDKADSDALLEHPAFGVGRRHQLITLLSSMPKTGGRGWMIRLANQCTNADQSDFLVQAISMLVERQRSGGDEWVSLKIIGRLPAAVNAKGELVVPAPVDYVTWTEEVAGFAKRDDLGTAPRILFHTGKCSEKAKAGFSAAGWKMVPVL